MENSLLTVLGIAFLVPAAAKQVLLAAVIGLLIGTERAWRNKVASLRTFSIICAGSCVFALLSVHGIASVTGESPGAESAHDITRIAAQVVSGIGFLGGGVIFKTADRVEGISTAAMIWLTAAVGMACGFNQVQLAVWAFLVWAFLDLVSILLHRAITRVRGGNNGVVGD